MRDNFICARCGSCCRELGDSLYAIWQDIMRWIREEEREILLNTWIWTRSFIVYDEYGLIHDFVSPDLSNYRKKLQDYEADGCSYNVGFHGSQIDEVIEYFGHVIKALRPVITSGDLWIGMNGKEKQECPFYTEKDGKAVCRIYPTRPDMCRVFPIVKEHQDNFNKRRERKNLPKCKGRWNNEG